MERPPEIPVIARLHLALDCLGGYFTNLDQERSLSGARTRLAVEAAKHPDSEAMAARLAKRNLTLQRLAPMGIKALDDGGGRTMDEAFNPGAATWSIETGALLHGAQERLDEIARALADPHAWLERAVRHGEHLGPELLQRAGQVQEVMRRQPAETDDTASRSTLPRIGPHDMQAWQASLIEGVTQKEIAEHLNRQHGTSYTQARVSEMIKRAKSYAEASGLAEHVQAQSPRREAPISMDPVMLDLGERTDGAGHHQRARSRQRARDE